MKTRGILRVSLEVLEGPPVLQGDGGIAEPCVKTQESNPRVGFQFTKHARHRTCHWQPLVQFPNAIDAHTDQEHDNFAIERSCHSVGYYIRHGARSFTKKWPC